MGRPLPGLPGLLGIELVRLDVDHVEARLTVTEAHQVPDALHAHAGAVVTLADTVCGYGCRAALPDTAKGFITLELKTNLLRASLPGDRLVCVGRPLHVGRRTQIWDAAVTVGDAQRVVAAFRCTQLVL
jgi:1,4-dihydroxy-2-naphthoyl-CoA hydrolase